MSLELFDFIKSKIPELHVYPGQDLCTSCIKKLIKFKASVVETSSSSTELDDIEDALATIFSDENEGSSPLISMKLSH